MTRKTECEGGVGNSCWTKATKNEGASKGTTVGLGEVRTAGWWWWWRAEGGGRAGGERGSGAAGVVGW